MKKIITLSIITSIFATSTMTTFAQSTPKPSIDGKVKLPINAIFNEETSENILSSRDVASLFNYEINWLPNERAVLFINDENTIKASIDSNEYIINDKKVKLDTNTIIIEDTSYIPDSLIKLMKSSEINSDISEKIYKIVIEDELSLYNEQVELNKEHKEAFLSTVGNLEEYREPFFQIGANILSVNNETISVNVYKYTALASSMIIEKYYTIDINTGQIKSLQDYLGENYIEICENSVVEQMKVMEEKDPEDTMFFENSYDELVNIDKNTSFYINSDEEVVLVFPKYSIAAGVYGIIEFTILPIQ